MAPSAQELCPLIQVFDMPRSLAFYRDLLGFTRTDADSNAVADDCDWCLLRLGDAWLMLNTAYERHERPPAPDPARIEAHGDTGLFISVEGGLDRLAVLLTGNRVAHTPPQTQPYGMRQLYVRDPDGYTICFQHPADFEG